MSKYIDGTRTVYFDDSNGNLTVPGTLAIGTMSTGTSKTSIVSTLAVNTSSILANNIQTVSANVSSQTTSSIVANNISTGVLRSGNTYITSLSTPTVNVSSITTTGRLQISTIRNDETLATGFLHYNPSTSEIVYNSVGGGGGGGGGVLISASTIVGTESVIAPTEFFAQELYTTTAYELSQFGQSFVRASIPLYYTGVTVSASGQYILACDSGNGSGGYLWRSSNFGASFQQVGTRQTWARVAMNATGQIQVAAIGGPANGQMYQSVNYGLTWTLLSGSPIAYCAGLAISASGQYISLTDQSAGALTNGNIWTSSTFGASWTLNSSAPNIVWNSIAMSASGQYQTACAYGGSIWRSVDYGQNWASTGVANNSYYDVSMSASGQYQTVAAIGGSGNLYVSSDYGVTWTTKGILGTAYTGVAVSASGQYQMSFVNGGAVYQSSNNGQTWTTTLTNSKSWRDIAMSAAANITVVAANNPEYIYINSLSQFLPSPQQSLNPLITEEFTVAVGTNGGANSWIAYSYDGQNWIQNNAASNLFTSFCFGVAWNGILWIATGYGTNSLATSPDGINWTANSSALTQAVYIRSVAWNGSMWVGVGVSNPNQCIIYSYDGLTWYPSNNGTAIFGSTCFAIAWNGVLWVAGGASGSQGIVGYSYDGINWNQSSSATGLLPAGTLTGLIWGGGLWITGCGNVIIRSSDGINWTVSNNALFSGGNVGGFAYNGVIYIATGSYSGGGMIATSPDGITWTANSTLNPLITGYGGAAVWNGSLWIVTGASSTNAGVVITSPDGINWTVNQSASNIFIEAARGIANRKISETAIKQLSTFSNLAITPNVVGSAPSNFMKNYITSGSSLEYGAVAISADGKYQLAGTYTGSGGNLYVSSNYGVSFTAVLTGVGTWYDAAMSDAGNIMYATNRVGGVAGVYISINYGQTWTLIPGLSTNSWLGISCSASGQYVLAGGPTQNYLSSNYGSTWTGVGPSHFSPGGVAVSATGQYMIISPDNATYISRDYGATFVATGINAIGLAISGTGQYILLGDDPNSLYLSSDYGATFTRVGILSAPNYYIKCSIDYTGQYQVVTILDIGVYYSNDYGRTWTSVPILAVPQARTAAVSANAQYVISALRNGYIYVFNNPVPVPSLLATTVTQTNQLLVNSATVTGNITALSANVNSLTTQNISSVTARVSSLYVSSILNSGSFFISSLRNDAALTSGTVHYNSTTKELVYNDSGGAQSTISSYQNLFTSSLGINCNSPQYILDVNGTGNFLSTLSPFAYFSTANASTANISTAFISSAQLGSLGTSSLTASSIVSYFEAPVIASISTANISTANISTANISTGQVRGLGVSSLTASSIVSYFEAPVIASISTANISTANISTALISSAQVGNASVGIDTISTANISTANISTANISTGQVRGLGVSSLTASSIVSYFEAPVIASISTANISTANISTAFISSAQVGSANVGTATISTANISTANISTANISTAQVGIATVSSLVSFNNSTVNATITSSLTFGYPYFSWQTRGTTLNNFVQTSLLSNLNISSGLFTLECYFNPTGTNSFWGTIVSLNNGTTNNGNEFRIVQKVAASGFGMLFPSASGSADATSNIANILPLNSWYHLALVRTSATNLFLYSNGTAVLSTTILNYSQNQNMRLQIFSDPYVGGNDLGQGYVQSVRFTAGQALYTGNFTPPTQQLTRNSVGTNGARVVAQITGTVAFLGGVTSTFTDAGPYSLALTAGSSNTTTNAVPSTFSSIFLTTFGNSLGINCNAPSFTLDVNGSANFNGGLGVSSLTASSITAYSIAPVVATISTANISSANISSALVGMVPAVFAQSFVQVNNTSQLNYNSAMSSNGQYQLVGTNNNLYVSSNFGGTWTARGLSKLWVVVAVSGTGDYMYACDTTASTGNLYKSTDYGTTWAIAYGSLPLGSWNSVAVSSSGQYVLALGPSFYYLSTNYGATFSQIASYAANAGVAISSTGQYMILGTATNITFSSNYGSTWATKTPGGGGGQAMAISGTGQYQLAGNTGNTLYLSSDYGATFAAIAGLATTAAYWTCAIDYTGQYQLTGQLGTNVYYSVNYGVTWTLATNYPNPSLSRSVSISANAQYILAPNQTGYFYGYSAITGINTQAALISTAFISSALIGTIGNLNNITFNGYNNGTVATFNSYNNVSTQAQYYYIKLPSSTISGNPGNASTFTILGYNGTDAFTRNLFTIQPNGSIGIGGCNAPQYTLDVNGTINASLGVRSNGTFLTSDRRIKEFITDADLDICYSNVKNLSLRRYAYISTFKTTKIDGSQIGFIADEVSSIFPKSVKDFPTTVDPQFSTIQHMNYDQIFLAHYGATQKLMTVVEDQTAKLAQQSTQMAQLLADNSTLTSMCSYIPQLMNTVSTLKG